MPEIPVLGGRWWQPGDDSLEIPAVFGAYVLELHLEAHLTLAVGRLGTVLLPAGYWRYFGSAYGPGGLRARVLRHLRPAQRRDRWHIDRLTRAVPVRRVLPLPGGSECALVRRHLAMGWTAPIPGFGASDCRSCPAHLLWTR